MLIAEQLRTTNRAEYLLYLWQVEDIVRAHGCDFDRLREAYLSRFSLTDELRQKTEKWYEDLCEMMRTEGVSERGHLQMSKNVLQELTELHIRLSNSSRFPYYREMYYRVLPYVVELRAKRNGHEEGELTTCFEALYGLLMLRLQGKEVSESTARAATDITSLLGQLSDYWLKDRQQPLEFE